MTKVRLAALLRRLAQRLDPAPYGVRTAAGWTIEFPGIGRLANIKAGDIGDTRAPFDVQVGLGPRPH